MKRLVLLAALLAIAALVVASLRGSAPGSEDVAPRVGRDDAPLPDEDAELADASAPGTTGAGGATRSAQDVPGESVEPGAGATSDDRTTVTHRGRVVDPEERPMAGVRVGLFGRADEATVRATSDAHGRFELEAPRGPGVIRADDPDVVNLYVFRAHAAVDAEACLVVARHRPLAGVVVDADERPLRDALVELALPAGFETRFRAVFDNADAQLPAASTDGDGRFALERVPVIDGATVRARLDGYRDAHVDAPPFAASDLRLVMESLAVEGPAVAGRVDDARGVPAPGANVTLGELATRTATDGTFRLDRSETLEARELVAALPGHLPARFVADTTPGGEPRFPDFVVLRLGGPPLELRGRVIDGEGRPVPRAQVWLVDPTEFGTVGDDVTAQLENLTVPDENSYEIGGDPYIRRTRTNAEGRFLLQGLLEREYTLGVLQPERMQVLEAGPFAAGRDDVEIVVPAAEVGDVRGRVVDPSGAPVAQAHVKAYVHLWGGVAEDAGEVVTGADGAFAFEGIAAEEVRLVLRGTRIAPTVRTLERSDEPTDVVVDVLRRFQVDLTGFVGEADGVRAKDADGDWVTLYDMGASGFTMSTQFGLNADVSGPFGVGDEAVEIALFAGGAEVRSIPVTFVDDEVAVVRP